MFSWYKYLIVNLVISHLGFWSGNLLLITPFHDFCLLVPFHVKRVCKRLVETGLWVNGDLLSVREYDDVIKEEHDAYQYNLIFNEYRKVKQTIKQRRRDTRSENLSNKN